MSYIGNARGKSRPLKSRNLERRASSVAKKKKSAKKGKRYPRHRIRQHTGGTALRSGAPCGFPPAPATRPGSPDGRDKALAAAGSSAAPAELMVRGRPQDRETRPRP